MKLVIDISKDRYDEIMSMDWKNCGWLFGEEFRAIHDGKALGQEPQTGWIPVSERLPEESGRYLATIQTFGKHTFMRFISFATNLSLIDKYDFKGKKQAGWYDCDPECGYYEENNVIAWQPLPEPYEESEG